MAVVKETIAASVKTRFNISTMKSKQYVTDFFLHMESLLVDGTAIKIPYHGYISAHFKKGGRPVRNPKTGDTMPMRDTYNIKLSNSRNKDHKKMNWSELVASVSDVLGRPAVADFICFTFARHLWSVKDGERIEIRGLGSFYCVEVRAKVGRNPKTGERVEVEEKTKVQFRASKGLVRRINKKYLGHE